MQVEQLLNNPIHTLIHTLIHTHTVFYSTCVYRRDNSLLEKPLRSLGMRRFMGIVMEVSKSHSIHAQIASMLKKKRDEWFISAAKQYCK